MKKIASNTQGPFYRYILVKLTKIWCQIQITSAQSSVTVYWPVKLKFKNLQD